MAGRGEAAKRKRKGSEADEGAESEWQAISEAIDEAVEGAEVIDLHTHLFPPSHGDLMLWGIDALLTYHYLVSEFFMVAPNDLTPQHFFRLPRPQQADLVWEHLFLMRAPLSEAQIGVLTTLKALGLGEAVRARDLTAIRKWFAEQDPDEHVQNVLKAAGVHHVIMTNIPFDEREAQHWLDKKPVPKCFKSALRVDQLLSGDWDAICKALRKENLELTFAGARHFLCVWADRMLPEYLMASTPSDFVYDDTQWKDHEAIESPGGVPTATELIDKVLIPVAKKRGLALALKLGAMRGMNPDLNPCGGGDGVVVADLGPLRRLAAQNPDVKFLATILSRVNQHELCVLAQKFRNVHVYGCWWYCNNPSMIKEITEMRLEMLGTAFTAQHSDARVLEQLVYKWIHSRTIIRSALQRQYRKLWEAGWLATKEEVRRDVWRLLGGEYTDFMANRAPQ